jgi:3D (Asp-Asp-Asp) domain-containing protein
VFLLLSRSIRRKVLATAMAGAIILLAHQATVYDSLISTDSGTGPATPLKSGARAGFDATAYCKGEQTAAGISVQAGMVAADPKILPLGSIIQIDRVDKRYKGIYSVLDTGPEIQGHELDLYMWSCNEALAFGRQKVQVTVLRRGWVEGNVRK